ncbi:hypothetical protein NPIL_521641 [Nephila pilipes]|uniref:Spider venom protein n=1 Tax=Nephila pilipes TaxID=299642 RepID=A0A8X6Q6R2_NEPPI|nr:hypothetical protein NPIL_521641 [Nephila pilipes]
MKTFVTLLMVLVIAVVIRAENQCRVTYHKCCEDEDCPNNNYCYEQPCGNSCGHPILLEQNYVRVKPSKDCIPITCQCGYPYGKKYKF